MLPRVFSSLIFRKEETVFLSHSLIWRSECLSLNHITSSQLCKPYLRIYATINGLLCRWWMFGNCADISKSYCRRGKLFYLAVKAYVRRDMLRNKYDLSVSRPWVSVNCNNSHSSKAGMTFQEQSTSIKWCQHLGKSPIETLHIL